MTHSDQDKYCFSGRTLLLFYPPLCTNENIATHVLQLSANENITFICMFTQQHIIQEKKMAPIAINVSGESMNRPKLQPAPAKVQGDSR